MVKADCGTWDEATVLVHEFRNKSQLIKTLMQNVLAGKPFSERHAAMVIAGIDVIHGACNVVDAARHAKEDAARENG